MIAICLNLLFQLYVVIYGLMLFLYKRVYQVNFLLGLKNIIQKKIYEILLLIKKNI